LIGDTPVAGTTHHPQLPGGLAATPGPGRFLRPGCHLLDFTRELPATGSMPIHHVGTLRVEATEQGVVASGDLYFHGVTGGRRDLLPEAPDPSAGVPVFARGRYRSYVRVTGLDADVAGADVALAFELHHHDERSNTWTAEGPLSVRLTRTRAPAGYPSPDDHLRGDVLDTAGEHAGSLTVGWVSPFLRRAVVEIDRVADCERPLANGAGLDWRGIFGHFGWDLTVLESDDDLVEPEGETWSVPDLHAAVCARRDSADLDSEWRFWLVCVRRIETEDRGLMFDDRAGDSNNIPREGAAIASHWTIPEDDTWGSVKGMRFGAATDPYFRTALHEIGHATGLYHSGGGTSIMRPTDAIGGSRFPQNVSWSHLSADRRRLRHLPDIWVRPGGLPFGDGFETVPGLPEAAIAELDGVRLDVSALQESVPIGAPVRVELRLRNTLTQAVPTPADLSLKGGQARGSVVGPSGEARSFRPLLRRMEPRPLEDLAPGDERTSSMTLLRGAEGALFAVPGPHTIRVLAEWVIDGMAVRATGLTTVMVLPALDAAHGDAALRVLRTPDVLLTLAIGGDHLTDGIGAVHTALGSAALRPHYAYVEAKRLATPSGRRAPDLVRAAELIEPVTVMSAGEVDKATRLLVAGAHRGGPPPARVVGVLRAKAREALAAHSP
jgi:hypothetical protein